MRLIRLQAVNFRNLSEEPSVWAGGMNLVMGGNGEGKTNLLEAVAVLGTLRSFRGAGWSTVARCGRRSLCVGGELEIGGVRRQLEQVVELGPPVRRTLRVDGREVGAAEYLQWFPIFAMSPADAGLIAGAPELRRALVDRLAFLLGSSHLAHLRAYRRSLRQRTAALRNGAGDGELTSWEEGLAVVAARVVTCRLAAVGRLSSSFQAFYTRLGRGSFPPVSLRYRGEPWFDGIGSVDLAEAYRGRFLAQRPHDRELGLTSEGPHRHDLVLLAGGRPARAVLSSGQQRIVGSALRLAALAEVELERSQTLPVVVDDADAELDGYSFEQLLEAIGSRRQVFLSSAHEEVAGRVSPDLTIWVRGGACWRRALRGEVA